MDDLFEMVYSELRRIAGRQLRAERPGHTLCTTALVNEAWVELAKLERIKWRSRAQFLAIAHILLQQGRIEDSLATWRESVELSRRAHHADGVVQSLRALGNVLFFLGRDAEALPLLEEAASLFARLEDRVGQEEMSSRVATALERLGEPARAASIWSEVRDLRADLGDAQGELAALEGVARAARKAGAPVDEVVAHTAAALALASTLRDARRELALHNTLGILEWEAGRYQDALEHYEAGLRLARDAGDLKSEGLMLNSLGVTLARLDRPEEARTALEESVALAVFSLRLSTRGSDDFTT